MTVATHPQALSFGAIQVGDEIKPVEIIVTASVVVAGAIASRDSTATLSLPLGGGAA